ncbi:heme-binding beta-barrel domain-containing protein [Myxococcota bacterium]|nr:heme-binding beta-barrel domain-containing protein [Myxococcota bacterium]
MANEEFGPLAGLIGSWRGESGVNVSYDYEQKKVIEETYTEEMTFKIVGDVDNGKQKIWCLDYITAAKRTGSDDIFHTELGFWGWDPVRGEVMRCFMVPRMSTILAGGTAKADDTSFSLSAKIGAEDWGVLSNPYLLENAKCTRYESSYKIDGDTFSYEENTVMAMKSMGGKEMDHTDKHTLTRV